MSAEKASKRPAKAKVSSDNTFYESMPISMGSHYVYRDDLVEQYQGAGKNSEESYSVTARRVAIITLIVTAVLAVIIGILFAQGLSVFTDAMPVNQTTTGLQEL